MTTIYYLSATGNSLYVAKTIKARLEEHGSDVRLLSIDKAMQTEKFHPEGDVGFVMPLHFFAVPLLAEDFFEHMDLHQAQYTFVVMTSAWHYTSDAFHELRKLFAEKGSVLKAAFYVDMVSIYLPFGNVPPEEKQQRILRKAAAKTELIAEKIVRHAEEQDREYLGFLLRFMHRGAQKHRTEMDKDFQVSTACSGCGFCAAVCPVSNIVITDGRPVWQHHCTQCLACIHICPRTAIDMGERTKKYRRYRHPGVTAEELMKRF